MKTLLEIVQIKLTTIIKNKNLSERRGREIESLEKDIFKIDKTKAVDFDRVDSNYTVKQQIKVKSREINEYQKIIKEEKEKLFSYLRDYQDVELNIPFDNDIKTIVVSQYHNPDIDEDEIYVSMNGSDL